MEETRARSNSTSPLSPDRFPVLVVEDDDAIRPLVVRYIKAHGYVVSSAASAEEGLEVIVKLEAPILVVDQNLPGMSGLDMVEKLGRSRRDFEAILVTAYADVDSLARSVALGFFRCILKPFHNEELVSAVAGAASRLWLRLDLRARKAELETRNAELEARLKELHEAQQHRLLSERLASIGRLAAGVAHEINSPLAAVIANLALISEELLGPTAPNLGAIGEMLHDAREAAERVRTIVKDMKTCSRADEERVGPVDLQRAAEASINMVFNEVRHHARLVKDFGEIPPVQGNEARLGQVVLNLLLNAAQAIPEGNSLRNEIRVVTRMRGDKVCLEVRDTGGGMIEEVRQRIFDPFFTTKPIGVGTGLGLAISHGIVSGYGGDIEVESEVGKGSVFRVLLPPAAKEVVNRSLRPRGVEPVRRRAQVLVIDDDRAILRALERVLALHDVVAVSSARDALAILDKGRTFDVTLCDLMMPDMTGMEFHEQLAKKDPARANAIVFLTGGTFTDDAKEFLDRVSNVRLIKPFDPDEIRRLVADRMRPG